MVGVTTAVGAIDRGTTSTKGLVLATAGRLEVVAKLCHRQFYPQPGWVEHDAGWRCQSKFLNTWEVRRTARLDPEKSRKINGGKIRF
jgi:glycerol kinase